MMRAMKGLSVVSVSTLFMVWSSACSDRGLVNLPEPRFSAAPPTASTGGWAKTYSGPAQDEGAAEIRETPDGGFIVAGWTGSFGAGDLDFWVLKLDAAGDPEWEKTYGGSSLDIASQVVPLGDGYVVAGLTFSFGSSPHHEPLVLRLDLYGNVVWQRVYRSSLRDWGRIEPTSDGGFILAGGEDPGRVNQNVNGRVLKLDANGNITNQKIYGANRENLSAIRETTDGGYIVVGHGGSCCGGAGDLWILKLREDLETEWTRTFGGPGNEAAFDVRQIGTGSYVVAGNTRSAGAGGADAWVLLLDSSGERVWDRTFGGSADDFFSSIQLTEDGGFIASGGTQSFGSTGSDAWVVKLRSDGTPEWNKTFDTGALDEGQVVRAEPTSDGGYVVASMGDTGCPLCTPRVPGPHRFFVLKLQSDGSIGSSCPAAIGADQVSPPGAASDPGVDWVAPARSVSATAPAVNVAVTATSATVQTICANEPPDADPDGPYAGTEGSPVSVDGSGSSDPDGDPLTYEWDFGDSNVGTGPTPTHTYADDDSYDVCLTVSDGRLSDTRCTTASISNVAPSCGPVTGLPTDPVRVGTTVYASSSFTDPGTLDTHTALWTWDDGTTDPGSITETGGSGTVGADDHTYTEAGVYEIGLTVTDKDGGLCTESYQYVVAYDPEGGFVTGGGWIDSPQGAYVPDPSLAGKATFGFVSKYKKGASVPSGNTEFHFKAADLDFHSSAYDWLVVTGSNYARFKGSGTINGMGDYRFMLWAGDDAPDTFRIRIWTEDESGNETEIYDNGMDQALGGGSIVIHTN